MTPTEVAAVAFAIQVLRRMTGSFPLAQDAAHAAARLQQLIQQPNERPAIGVCPVCHTTFPIKARGRIKLFCSEKCKQTWRRRRAG